MRVLFVIAALRNGGAERVLSALSAELSKQNEVHIAVLEEDLGFYKFDKSIKFHTPNIYNGSKIAVKFKKILAIRSLFKSVNPDLIVSFIDWTNVACVVANLGLNYKHIATEHHANEYLRSPKFRLIRDLAYRKIDGLSVLSKSDFEYYSFVKNREVLHNPLFLNKTDENLEKENLVLSVGRLEYVKGYDVYFRALALISPEILQGWQIAIAGSGKEEQNLKNLAKNLGLNVKFLGHMDDVGSLYARAKIFVLSSRSEGLSNVLIESANFGCARLSSDTVGAKELIIHGKNGLLFECENENELSSHLVELLCDEKLRQNLANNAKAQIGEFSQENIMQKWHKFIQKVMES